MRLTNHNSNDYPDYFSDNDSENQCLLTHSVHTHTHSVHTHTHTHCGSLSAVFVLRSLVASEGRRTGPSGPMTAVTWTQQAPSHAARQRARIQEAAGATMEVQDLQDLSGWQPHREEGSGGPSTRSLISECLTDGGALGWTVIPGRVDGGGGAEREMRVIRCNHSIQPSMKRKRGSGRRSVALQPGC